MPITVVIYGSLALVVVLAAVPQLGLGLSFQGVVGAAMILLFGFLFVTVSSRLTGEVGSSSNPISGMTIATILLVCLIFFLLGRTGPTAMLTALTVAAVVCIASSNGGTTSQDLKTGYLVGATPSKQQWAILIGAGTSALVIGGTMLMLNNAQTHYTKQGFSHQVVLNVPDDAPKERPGKPYDRDQAKIDDKNPGWKADTNEYRIVHVRAAEYSDLKPGPLTWWTTWATRSTAPTCRSRATPRRWTTATRPRRSSARRSRGCSRPSSRASWAASWSGHW